MKYFCQCGVMPFSRCLHLINMLWVKNTHSGGMMKNIIGLSILVLLGCSLKSKEMEIQIIQPNVEKKIIIPLDTIYSMQTIEILKNTLNDTCKIGIVIVSTKIHWYVI